LSSSVAVAAVVAIRRFVSRPGRPETVAPVVTRSYLQNFLYGPMQTWLFFRKPSVKRSL
jgi:hypothetical protein